MIDRGCREALVDGDCGMTRVTVEGMGSDLMLPTLPPLPWHCSSVDVKYPLRAPAFEHLTTS